MDLVNTLSWWPETIAFVRKSRINKIRVLRTSRRKVSCDPNIRAPNNCPDLCLLRWLLRTRLELCLCYVREVSSLGRDDHVYVSTILRNEESTAHRYKFQFCYVRQMMFLEILEVHQTSEPDPTTDCTCSQNWHSSPDCI